MNTQSPKTLSDICGAERIGTLVPIVMEFTGGTEVIERGTIVSVDPVSGKVVPTTAGNETSAYGVTLDESIDTSVEIDGKVTGTIARHGSFKASQLIVGAGTDIVQVATTLRHNGVYLEGYLPASGATAATAASATTHKPHKTH